MSRDIVSGGMNSREPKGKKELHSLRLEIGKNGGHTVTHNYEGYGHEPDVHVFGKTEGNALVKHLVDKACIDCDLKDGGEKGQNVGGGAVSKGKSKVEDMQ